MNTIYSPLTRRTRKVFDSFFSYRTVGAGEVLMRQGEPGDEFILVADGGAEVTIDGTCVSSIRSGGFCGELALLPHISRSDGLRRATVTTTRASQIGVCDRAGFMRMRERLPQVGGVILVQAYQLCLEPG